MAFNYSPKTSTNGLVLYLDAANANSYVSGNTQWNDLSKTQDNCSLVNGPTYSSLNGGAIVFDGTNDYGILSSTLDIGTVGSWSLWLNAVAFGGVIIGSNIANYYMIYYVGGVFYINYGSALGSISGTTLSVGTWYNITITRNGNTHEIFVNGLSIGTVSIATANTSKFSILADERSTSPYPFRGKFASFSVYNRVLTTTEVLNNFNTTKTRFGL
jgi:hypothetical protein